MSKNALLVIDVQRAFFGSTACPPVHDDEGVLARIGAAMRRARAAGLPIVYLQHSAADGSGHPLEQGTDGWQIQPEVAPEAGDLVIAKTTPDSFHETPLKAELDRLGVDRVIVAGNQTEFCVDTTCRRARGLGYDVTLLRDAHSTWDNAHLSAQQIIDHHNFVLGRQFVTLCAASDVDFDGPS